jgi:hypothetical protein
MPKKPHNAFDLKLREAIRALVEVRIMAAKIGAEYRTQNNLPYARSFESIAYQLQDNQGSMSLQTLTHIAEGQGIDLPIDPTVTDEEVEASAVHLYRYLRIMDKL